MLPLLLAGALFAAAPLDSPHAAVLSVLSRDDDAAGCDAAQVRAAATSATIRRLGAIGGSDVVLANVANPCICGAQNCPYYVLRLDAGTPRVLYQTIGVTARVVAASPLPTLVFGAHDSALVHVETVAAYRGGRYVDVSYARVRGDTGARKPNAVPVRFAPGASSAVLHGSASLGWYDEYAFDASKGQQITVVGVRAKAPLTATIFSADSGTVADLKPGTPWTLPRSGSYRLHVELGSDTELPYELTFSIR